MTTVTWSASSIRAPALVLIHREPSLLDADSIFSAPAASEAAAIAATEQVLSLPDPPAELFTSQNLITIGAVRALCALGLEDGVAEACPPVQPLLEPASA